jgi:hypothetical protein
MPSLAALLGPLVGADPEATLFWSGAGISVDFPTCGPSGDALTRRALTHTFEPGIATTLAAYYRALNLPRRSPRLETVLQVVEDVHGTAVLHDLLTDLEAAPNPLHAFFAGHLEMGGRHVTMNFDTCIERAATKAWPHDALLHVHGQLREDGMGATLARIERGLPAEIGDGLRRLLLSPELTSIVFVGYSGSDFFDVDPFLASLPRGSLTARNVLWIEHGEGLALVERERTQLRALREAGAHVREVKASTRTVLKEIGRQWGVSLNARPGQPRPWSPDVPIDPRLKQRATVELFALMGLHREVDSRIELCRAHDWEVLAQTRWAQGRYADAGAAWTRARAGASPAARAERAGAVAWIRGEFRGARDLLVEALREAEGTLEERLTLAETLARVYVHTRRTPDSRGLAGPQLRDFILDDLPDPATLADNGRALGIHLRNRVVSARTDLGASSADALDAFESFGEYEALNAQLNYQHGRLRSRKAHEPVAPREFRALRRGFAAIGAYGDAARAELLAGPRVFSLRELWRAAHRLQITRRQRIRLLAASVLGGIRPRLKRS